MMSWCLLLIYAWSDLTYGTGWGGAYAFNTSLLALWLIVLGDDAYMAKWHSLLWDGYVLSISYDSWSYIVDVHIRFVDDAYMVITSWSSLLGDEPLICCCHHIHKDHTIMIVLGTYMDEDCWLDTWMIIQSCIVGGLMMMKSYLYGDKLFCTYVDWCRCFLLMALGSCRSGWLWMSWCRSTLLLTDTMKQIIQCCCWCLS